MSSSPGFAEPRTPPSQAVRHIPPAELGILPGLGAPPISANARFGQTHSPHASPSQAPRTLGSAMDSTIAYSQSYFKPFVTSKENVGAHGMFPLSRNSPVVGTRVPTAPLDHPLIPRQSTTESLHRQDGGPIKEVIVENINFATSTKPGATPEADDGVDKDLRQGGMMSVQPHVGKVVQDQEVTGSVSLESLRESANGSAYEGASPASFPPSAVAYPGRRVQVPPLNFPKQVVPQVEEVIRTLPKVSHHVVERLVEVPQVQYVERVVEVPQIQYQEIIRTVPKVQVQEILRQVPKVQYQTVEKIVEVPEVQYKERIVEVPEIHLQEVVKHVPKTEIKEKVVEVPKVEIEYVEREVLVPEIQYVDKIVEVPEVHVQEVLKPVPKVEVQEVIKHVPKHETVYVEKLVEVPEIHYVEKLIEVPRLQIEEVAWPVTKIEVQQVPFEIPGAPDWGALLELQAREAALEEEKRQEAILQSREREKIRRELAKTQAAKEKVASASEEIAAEVRALSAELSGPALNSRNSTTLKRLQEEADSWQDEIWKAQEALSSSILRRQKGKASQELHHQLSLQQPSAPSRVAEAIRGLAKDNGILQADQEVSGAHHRELEVMLSSKEAQVAEDREMLRALGQQLEQERRAVWDLQFKEQEVEIKLGTSSQELHVSESAQWRPRGAIDARAEHAAHVKNRQMMFEVQRLQDEVAMTRQGITQREQVDENHPLRSLIFALKAECAAAWRSAMEAEAHSSSLESEQAQWGAELTEQQDTIQKMKQLEADIDRALRDLRKGAESQAASLEQHVLVAAAGAGRDTAEQREEQMLVAELEQVEERCVVFRKEGSERQRHLLQITEDAHEQVAALQERVKQRAAEDDVERQELRGELLSFATESSAASDNWGSVVPAADAAHDPSIFSQDSPRMGSDHVPQPVQLSDQQQDLQRLLEERYRAHTGALYPAVPRTPPQLKLATKPDRLPSSPPSGHWEWKPNRIPPSPKGHWEWRPKNGPSSSSSALPKQEAHAIGKTDSSRDNTELDVDKSIGSSAFNDLVRGSGGQPQRMGLYTASVSGPSPPDLGSPKGKRSPAFGDSFNSFLSDIHSFASGAALGGQGDYIGRAGAAEAAAAVSTAATAAALATHATPPRRLVARGVDHSPAASMSSGASLGGLLETVRTSAKSSISTRGPSSISTRGPWLGSNGSAPSAPSLG